ncbi:MAG: thiol-disulfide isomerase/thioredoxin [Flavobacteriaceae bacterium]|jgi:thiol-disulfide isomerase/thioredoxin
MKSIIALTIMLVSLSAGAQTHQRIKLRKGNWIAELSLNGSDKLPFNFVVSKTKGIYSFMVENGEEMISLNEPVRKGDSLYVRFPFFNSELVFAATSKKSIEGYWVNFNKGSDYKVRFSSKKQKTSRFSVASKKKPMENVDGRWEVTFQPNTNSSYPAVGLFKQDEKKNIVAGTFLTETGDYRFLEGNIINDSLHLSCFDGSHAFLFKASINEGSIDGKFFSGSHWTSSWIAKRNESIELKSPDELTFVVNDEKVAFKLPDLKGSSYNFPNDITKNKVVIIQIMGTWCPNCLDETKYYKELYTNYHDRGLEIISIGYEVGDSFDAHATSIKRLADKLSLDFTFLVGGSAKKQLASEHFNMLNQIISFPTSIFIGRDGTVKRIHTGFNGPGTGDYYDEYVENTNSLIETLLAD